MSTAGDVVLLTNPSSFARCLAEELHAVAGLSAILIERRPRLGAMAPPRRMPPVEVAVWELEQRLRRDAERLLDEKCGASWARWPEGVPVHQTHDLNGPESLARLRALRPELCVVYGTGILRGPLIETPALGLLNAHLSLLPDYRGTFSEFWQILHERFDTVGATIHFIDAGVDTGDIVAQRPTEPDSARVDPFRLRSLNLLNLRDLYPQVVVRVLAGDYCRTRQRDTALPTARHRDMTLETKVALYTRLGLLGAEAAELRSP